MGKNQSASNLTNIIKQDASGNITFVSGSTTLMSVSSSGAITTTGNVAGTASYASNAELLDGLDSTVFTLTSSFAAQTASFTAFTASINSYTASQNITNSTFTLTSSFAAQTASFTAFTSSVNTFTASQLVLNGTYATTSSNTFAGIQTINSNLVVTGSITAQTLVVQTITSSVDFVTGSTRFGSILGNTHVFSGSVTMNPGGLFVSSSGNVGIGNIIPAYKLDVSGSGRFISYLDLTGGADFGPQLNIFSNNQSTNNITLAQGYANGTDNIGYLYNRATADFVFGTSNIERMRITSGGNVGIGYISPTVALQVSGTIAVGNATTTGWGRFSYDVATNQVRLQASKDGTDSIGLSFYTQASGGGFAERMIISGSNVGIGTSSPTNKLHISGSGANTQTLVLESSLSSANAYVVVKSASKIYFSGLSTDLSNSFIIYDGTADVARLAITSAGSVTVGNAAYQGVTTDFSITGDKVNANGYYSRLIFQNSSQSGGSSASIRGERTLSNFATELTFYTNINTSAGNGSERMRIKYDGTISIASGGNMEIENGYLSTSAGSGTAYCSKLFTSYSYPYIDTFLDSQAGASYEGRIIFRTNTGGGAFGNRMLIYNSGAVSIPGSLSKGSGSFRIQHPLASKKNTHQLVHSFIEGPQADLIYSGGVTLVDGKATINIDEAATMTEGTFEALNRNIRVFTSNETSWDNVRGKVVGNILTIECQNPESTDEISWMVIGERQDEHIMDTEWTDENGKVIVEPLIPEESN